MKASVYIETTVLSYLVARPSRDLVVAAHQQITREWWDKRRLLFDCYISQAVIEEISLGDRGESRKRVQEAATLTLLDIAEPAEELAKDLLSKQIIPAKALRDALHIAVAAASGMDFLLTWNCTHIANAQIEARITGVCRDHDLQPPVICTPEELMVG